MLPLCCANGAVLVLAANFASAFATLQTSLSPTRLCAFVCGKAAASPSDWLGAVHTPASAACAVQEAHARGLPATPGTLSTGAETTSGLGTAGGRQACEVGAVADMRTLGWLPIRNGCIRNRPKQLALAALQLQTRQLCWSVFGLRNDSFIQMLLEVAVLSLRPSPLPQAWHS